MAQAAPRIAQFNSNAGTGPYLFGPLTGFTGAGPRFDGAFALLPKIYDLLVSKDTRTKFNGTIAIFNDSFEQAFNGQKDLLDKYRILYGDLKSYYAIKDYKNALVKLQEITRLMLPQIEKEPIVGMANVKSGVFFRSNSTYQFNSFIVTSDERGTDHHKTDTFVTGGVFFPLRGQ